MNGKEKGEKEYRVRVRTVFYRKKFFKTKNRFLTSMKLKRMFSVLTHVGSDHLPKMVDVGMKNITRRTAIASCKVILPEEVALIVKKSIKDQDNNNNNEIYGTKGAVFQTAQLAGIMACKKTSELIPLCHQINLDKCHMKINFENELSSTIIIECTVITTGKTGVEMEALVGASNGALTIYDMCKALSHEIKITDLQLISKTGGKKDYQCNQVDE